jgi:ComF family protein
MNEFYDSFLNLLFPPKCVVCHTRCGNMAGRFLCSHCISSIERIVDPLCRLCGAEMAGELDSTFLCGECLASPPPFTVSRSLFRYDGAIVRLVHRLKYSKNHPILAGISEIVEGERLDVFKNVDYVIPVPLHLSRLRKRGFNQSAVLAKLIFEDQGVRYAPDLLCRKINTMPQSTLGGSDRRKMVRNLFAVNEKYTIKESVITLVDDVYTTGATVKNCSHCLRKAGAREVRVLTLARSKGPQCGWRL